MRRWGAGCRVPGAEYSRARKCWVRLQVAWRAATAAVSDLAYDICAVALRRIADTRHVSTSGTSRRPHVAPQHASALPQHFSTRSTLSTAGSSALGTGTPALQHIRFRRFQRSARVLRAAGMPLLPIYLALALSVGVLVALTIPIALALSLAVARLVYAPARCDGRRARRGPRWSGLRVGRRVGGGCRAGRSTPTGERVRRAAGLLEELRAAAWSTVTGVLDEDASAGANGVRLRVVVRRIAGTPTLTAPSRRVDRRWRARGTADGQWRAGRIIHTVATLRRPAHYLNPGVADERLALARRGLTLVGSVKSGTLVEVQAPGRWRQERAADLRAHVRDALATHVRPRDPTAAGIATAILIGDRTGLDPALEKRLQIAGTYHVIAISGGNIAVLTVILLGLARLFRVPRGWAGRWSRCC